METKDNLTFQDQLAALREKLADDNAGTIALTPQFAEELLRQVDDMEAAKEAADAVAPAPPDKGLAALAGIGPDASPDLGDTRLPPGVQEYDETVTSERMVAVGDLYYLFNHEKLGVFRVIRKLKELFQAGAIRLSSGDGAFRLYQFDRRDVLRYTLQERTAAYRRAFGYGSSSPAPGARANVEFHGLFNHFVNQVALFWRDKRISDVVRERAFDPSFGSIAIVRRAGLDLRNNLKFTSFGHLNVMRVEVMQLLEEAFKILGADDVKNLFGVQNAWEVVEEILVRYFNEQPTTSPRQRMAVTGREILRWLAQPHILKTSRVPFETLLLEIAEPSEEWLTSAQSLGLGRRMEANRVLPWDAVPSSMPGPTPGRRNGIGKNRLRTRSGKPLSRV
jgi:hypothetical protein